MCRECALPDARLLMTSSSFKLSSQPVHDSTPSERAGDCRLSQPSSKLRLPYLRACVLIGLSWTLLLSAFQFKAKASHSGRGASLAGVQKQTPSARSPEAIERLRQFMLERINADRDQNGLLNVEIDDLASRVAEEHCREMLEQDYLSHWSLDGRKPYMRYSMAGGTDAVAENLVAHDQRKIPFDEESLLALFDKFEEGFMAEKPPDDGHKRNILAPEHTHVGIGFAIGGSAMYVAQEFLNRYVKLSPIPRSGSLSGSFDIKGELLLPDTRFYGIAVYYESLPRSMGKAELDATRNYDLPADPVILRPRASQGYTYDNGETGEVEVTGANFRAPISFYKKQPGVYTVGVWVTARGKTFIATTVSVMVKE